ncbi:MAG: substrate-binding domain-containing protein [Candidatus Bathyarchaeota archaeon]|nr:substrate-binding domain-containing protein [Candidatus Bathyarchaeota archaeon]
MRNKGIGVWSAIIVVTVLVSVLSTTYFYGVGPFARGRTKLVVSTTTSLYDTGLLDAIEAQFEEQYVIEVYFISAGTGIAIEYAKRGDADLILVHSPPQELVFLEDGYGVCRKIVAYNFFSIVGFADDPANITGTTMIQALTRIVDAGREGDVTWVSRGDNSGTHTKEKSLWSIAGFNWNELRNEDWYLESGTGMGNTLLIADEKTAYTLADIGSYLKYYTDELISLEVLVDQDQNFINVYSVIAVNKNYNPQANFDAAISFIKYLASTDGQQLLADYGTNTYGRSLFFPAVQLLAQNTDPMLTQWIEDYAYFNGGECPVEYQDDHPELYH